MLAQLAVWLEGSSLGQAVRLTPWAWPALSSLHLLGMGLLFGAIAALDLRLLGLGRGIDEGAAIRFLAPLAALGLALAALSGAALFAGVAQSVIRSEAAPWKLAFLLLGLANVGAFHCLRRRMGAGTGAGEPGPRGAAPVGSEPGPPPTRKAARVSAAASLLCWTGCIVAGRLLAFV